MVYALPHIPENIRMQHLYYSNKGLVSKETREIKKISKTLHEKYKFGKTGVVKGILARKQVK